MKRKIFKSEGRRELTKEEINKLAEEGEKLREEISKRLAKLSEGIDYTIRVK